MAKEIDLPLNRRLLDAAIDQFGRLGFDGASTRDIARASGTTMSSITYHFGGKEGLYLACADDIADRIGAIHRPLLELMRQEPPQDADATRVFLLALVESFARFMLASESEPLSRFIVREQQSPTEAFERLYARVMAPVLEAATGLVALLRPTLDDRARRMLVLNALGMVLVLRIGRACVCRLMSVDELDSVTGEELLAGLRRSTLALLMEA